MIEIHHKDIPFLKKLLVLSDKEFLEEAQKMLMKSVTSMSTKTLSNTKYHSRRMKLLIEVKELSKEDRDKLLKQIN